MLETRFDGLLEDVNAIASEDRRTRKRLHDLEGFAQAYLDVQKTHRRAEERQYRRLANAIALGGLAMSVAMFVLAIVTLWVHTH